MRLFMNQIPVTCAVIHCHDMKLWKALLHRVPTTPEKVE